MQHTSRPDPRPMLGNGIPQIMFPAATAVLDAVDRSDLADIRAFCAYTAQTNGVALRKCVQSGFAPGVEIFAPLADKEGLCEALEDAALFGHAECLRILSGRVLNTATHTAALLTATKRGRKDCIQQLVSGAELDTVLRYLITRQHDCVDHLAPYLSPAQLSLTAASMPAIELPEIRARLAAIAQATALEQTTQAAGGTGTSRRV